MAFYNSTTIVKFSQLIKQGTKSTVFRWLLEQKTLEGTQIVENIQV